MTLTFKERLKRYPYVHLTYLLIPLVAIISHKQLYSSLIAFGLWSIIMITTVLLSIYTLDELDKNLKILVLIQCLCILGLAFVLNPTTVILLVFLTYYLPMQFYEALSKLIMTIYFGTLILILGLTLNFNSEYTLYVLVIEIILVICFVVNIRNVEKDHLTAKIRRQEDIIEELVADQERQRIAQDLHDTLGHVFASISIKANLAEKLFEKQPNQAVNQIKEIKQISTETLNQVRLIVENVQWVTFESEVQRVNQLLKQAQIEFVYFSNEYIHYISKENQTLLAMILRESINNIIKHSDASCVTVAISECGTLLNLRIQDNGMKLKEIPALESIKKRVQQLEGELGVHSNKEGLLLDMTFQKECIK